MCKYLSIIGRGRAKYRDLSVASRSIICRCRRQRQIIDLRAIDKSRYFARSRPIIVLLFTYKASLYLSLKLRHCINKVDVYKKLYTQTLFHKKLPDYVVFADFLCLQILPKDTDGCFSSFFLYSLSFFSVVNKTTRLLIVQKNEPPLFTKSKGNAHAQTIICR